MENNQTYHIIGAGIAGLYAAMSLKMRRPRCSIILSEASHKIGGRCCGVFSHKLGCPTDLATHVILNRNTLAAQIIGKENCRHKIRFIDPERRGFAPLRQCVSEAELAIFNTRTPAWATRLYVGAKLWPFWGLKAYFSAGDLEERLCHPLLSFVDDIRYGWIWQGVENDKTRVTALLSNCGAVDIKPQDRIVCAIDSFNYNKMMGGADFEYNTICNVLFRTSMALTLPANAQMLGLKNAQAQWLFATPQYCAVTISDTTENPDARKIWEEICELRDYNAAFMPETEVRTFPRATIRQDARNNRLRPLSARTRFDNLFICGDWTMKNMPCCIESAILSGRRAALAALKSKD